MSSFYLGVDGGGTKTEAVIVSKNGTLLGHGRSGSSNFGTIGLESARANIREAVQTSISAAGIVNPFFSAAFLGIAGTVSEDDRALVRGLADSLEFAPPNLTGIDHDARIALAGSLAGEAGIVQIMGTGTSCFGINSEGKRWMSGGWGHLIADEGGGYWFGIEALKAVTTAFDGRGEKTLLTSMVLDALQIPEIGQVMKRIYSDKMTVTEIAVLGKLVLTAASDFDELAIKIIERGIHEVVRCVEAVATQLGWQDAPFNFSYTGGITSAGGVVLDPLEKAIKNCLPKCNMQPPIFSAAIGAALLAYQQQNVITADFIGTLQQCLNKNRIPGDAKN